MTPAIIVQDIRKIYRPSSGHEVRALDGVSFDVPQGSIFGLLGPNGAGKTTMVKILTTMTPPTSGRASVLGFDVAQRPLEVRRRIAAVLQQTAVDPMLTVRDNLLIYAQFHGIRRADALRRMQPIVEEFELGGLLGETVQDLSLGTKRRVQVAKSFMVDSPVIFMDEATTGMDPLMKRRVLDRIRAEARQGRTVLLTTQVLSEAEELCDHIMIIDRGTLLASGTLSDLRRLAQQMFRVSLTVGGLNNAMIDRLRALSPAELKTEGSTVDMLFRGTEAALLTELAALASTATLSHFEIRGADLEEIFLALLKDAA